MRLGIEIAQFFGDTRSGLYYHALRLIRAMERLGEHRLTLLVGESPCPRRMSEVARLFHPLPVRSFRNPGRPYRWRLALSPFSRQDAVLYLTQQVGPFLPHRIHACLIPDLSPLLDPHWHTAENRRRWLDHFDWVRQHADLVITFSEHTRQQVAEHLAVPLDRVAAIPLAAAEEFQPLRDDARLERELRALGLRKQGYILCVGTLEPRKNHVRLLRAYRQLRERNQHQDHELVLVGPKGWHYDDVFSEIDRLQLHAHVRHLENVANVPAVMNGATVMAYPSLFEGFGLPPLEAMACGTPVIAGNLSSLPEVVGDAGVLIDPHDEDALAEALASVLGDAALRRRLRQAGLQRSRAFSWELTARGTCHAIAQAVQRRRQSRHVALSNPSQRLALVNSSS